VAGYILTIGFAVHFRVLGRHFMPLLPVVLTLLGAGLAACLEREKKGKLVVAAFLGFSLVSCLSLRLSARHAKDDYRSAAALGREALARGETVWWNADKQGALIYHLQLAPPPGSPKTAVFLVNPGAGFSRNLPVPMLVLTSKPDVYDMSGTLTEYLVSAGFHPTSTLAAFTIWRASSK
jgi:hypothetical protein